MLKGKPDFLDRSKYCGSPCPREEILLHTKDKDRGFKKLLYFKTTALLCCVCGDFSNEMLMSTDNKIRNR